MACQRMLKSAVVAISIALLLVPDPALLAPTLEQSQHLERMQRRQTASMLNISSQAVDAYNGIAVTFIYVSYTKFDVIAIICLSYICGQTTLFFFLLQTHSQPNFTNSQSSSAVSDITNTMCDLLAYHDKLGDFDENTTTATFQNSSRDLRILLEANIQDTCAWVRLA